MHHIKAAATAGGLAVLFALAGCAGSSGPADTAGGGGANAYGPATSSSASGSAVLSTADSSLGTIVIDGSGMTVYMFDDDTKGTTTSACTGTCLVNWPPVLTDGSVPSLRGVSGQVGLIDAATGKKQVTLDGWPLYYYAGDRRAGDVNGQGVGGIWWVLGADGTEIRG
ncbi:hypothetical protein ET475_13775 [Microbacterium protaetiae]|uniref:Lipoprotein n=1 Tax=Microbacterium protaetiae TaxID=2509458 RepID=A0A4P6EF20_9MICO|nr:hypothetical protein [Microbacterium protaetiae]QAY60952.1 hypothetical protein ET475_13775 [Microbacterium protaetiae]